MLLEVDKHKAPPSSPFHREDEMSQPTKDEDSAIQAKKHHKKRKEVEDKKRKGIPKKRKGQQEENENVVTEVPENVSNSVDTQTPPSSVVSPSPTEPKSLLTVAKNSPKDQFLNLKKELKTQKTEDLDDSFIDEIIQKIFCPMKKQGVRYISSQNMENVRRNHFKGVYTDLESPDTRKQKVLKHLDLTSDEIAKKDSMKMTIIVIHGPKVLAPPLKYRYRQIPGHDHWSLLVCFKDEGFYQYDSLNNYNERTCLETIKVLMHYDILPVAESDQRPKTPKFIPLQKQTWECGFYTLLFFHILMNESESESESEIERGAKPISPSDLEKFSEEIKTITDENGFFKRKLLHCLDYKINCVQYKREQ